MEITVATYPLTQLAHKNAALRVETTCLEVKPGQLPANLTKVRPQQANRPAWFMCVKSPGDLKFEDPTILMQLTFTFYMKFTAGKNKSQHPKKLTFVLTEIPYDGNTKFTEDNDAEGFSTDIVPELMAIWSDLSASMAETERTLNNIKELQINKNKRPGTLLN